MAWWMGWCVTQGPSRAGCASPVSRRLGPQISTTPGGAALLMTGTPSRWDPTMADGLIRGMKAWCPTWVGGATAHPISGFSEDW